MKRLLPLTALLSAIACQAADTSATAAPALNKPPQGRCPAPRIDKLVKMPEGDFKFVVRYTVKADGSVENVRVDGGKASREARRAARDAFDGMRCTPAETDQEYESVLQASSTRH